MAWIGSTVGLVPCDVVQSLTTEWMQPLSTDVRVIGKLHIHYIVDGTLDLIRRTLPQTIT